jgi:hypothetical protein
MAVPTAGGTYASVALGTPLAGVAVTGVAALVCGLVFLRWWRVTLEHGRATNCYPVVGRLLRFEYVEIEARPGRQLSLFLSRDARETA